jgi:uncharacterized OsmC-like protein
MTISSTLSRVNGIDTGVLKDILSAVEADPGLGKSHFRARNKWIGGTQNYTMISNFYAAKQEMKHKHTFKLHCDEPAMLAGADEGANPVEHLLNALAGCMTTSMVAHAAVRGIHIDEVESELEGDIDMRGFLGLGHDVPKGFTNIRVKFRVKADPDDMERLRSLIEFSPVMNTIIHGAKVDVEVEQK